MSEGGYTSIGLGDLLALLSASNPLAGVQKSVAQFQHGVNQFLESVERFNDTMDQLNQVARRVNGLLDTVEEPVQALVPQVTRTIKTADALVEQLRGPVEKVAPALAALPTDLTTFLTVLNDVSRRLQPLGQLAESAGSVFGLRPLAALRLGGGRPATASPPPPAPAKKAAPKRPAAKKAAPKKAAAKKKASPATKAAPKKKTAPKR
jgi:ABC-type transporter Mla subunit MlaD